MICDNADLRTIMVWECDPGVTEGCGQQAQCSRLLVIWTPGSRGEMLPVSTGMNKLHRSLDCAVGHVTD